jgi:hypothetical protein
MACHHLAIAAHCTFASQLILVVQYFKIEYVTLSSLDELSLLVLIFSEYLTVICKHCLKDDAYLLGY